MSAFVEALLVMSCLALTFWMGYEMGKSKNNEE